MLIITEWKSMEENDNDKYNFSPLSVWPDWAILDSYWWHIFFQMKTFLVILYAPIFNRKLPWLLLEKLGYFLFQHLDTLLPFAQKNKLYFSFFHFISFVLLVALDFIDIEILGAKTWQNDSLFFGPWLTELCVDRMPFRQKLRHEPSSRLTQLLIDLMI